MSTFGCVLWCILVGVPIVGSLALRLYDRHQKRAELRRTARLTADCDDDCARLTLASAIPRILNALLTLYVIGLLLSGLAKALP